MDSLAKHHQLHGVQPVLPVPDVKAAADWFVRVLGFEIDFLHGEPPYVHGRVKLGDRSFGDPIYIHLSRSEGAIQPCGETRLHVGHDIDGLHAHVLAQGGAVLLAPTDQPWGLREIVVQSPGGHRLVLGAGIDHKPATDLPGAACNYVKLADLTEAQRTCSPSSGRWTEAPMVWSAITAARALALAGGNSMTVDAALATLYFGLRSQGNSAGNEIS